MAQDCDKQLLLRNRYRVEDRLGTGGAGTVYAVEDLRKSETLALKAMFSSASQEVMLEALKREFRILATLRHPAIARVYDFGRIPEGSGLPGSHGRPGYFLTRDLVNGKDLEDHCQGLDTAEICQVCARTAEVLDVLHRSGMVHGDLKPANVIVSKEGLPHLIDFGLVHAEGQHGTGAGTMAYVAPETLAGRPVDRRVDLYALGISMYQLLTGSLPLPGATLAELISWHMDGDPLRVSPHLPDVPPVLDEVVCRLTVKDPDRRYPTTAEAALAITGAAQSCGAKVPDAIHSAPRLFVPPAPGENLTDPLVELEDAVQQRLQQGQEGVALVAVEGEPGSGKSTLLQELAWRCQLAEIEVLRGEFHAGDPRAFGLWTDLLAQVAGLCGKPSPLEGLPPGDAQRYATYQKIGEYLDQAAGRTPLLLLFDDAQEAGEESLAAMRFIAHTLSSTAPVMMVVAYRESDAIHDSLGAPVRQRLRPLSGLDLDRMVEDSSGRRDNTLAGRILQHTGGNPQFVMDVLHRLGEHGWPANPDLHRLAPPRSLEEMYTVRWQELPVQQQRVLEALAVLGRPSSGVLLMEVIQQVGEQPDEVGLPLEQLEAGGWLDRNSEGLFIFKQGPAARTVYELMEPEKRRALHGAAAQALHRPGLADQVERTRHALGARDLSLTLAGLEEALATLKGLGSHRDAIQICADVLQLPLEPHTRRQITGSLGDLQLTVGDFELAIEQLQQACDQAEGAQLVRARTALAKGYRLAGDVTRALQILTDLDSEGAPSELRMTVLWETAAANMSLDRHEQVLVALEEAISLGEQIPEGMPIPMPLAELKGRLGYALAFLERHDRATEVFEEALQDARGAGDQRVEADILSHWAAAAMRQGDFSEATGLYQRMLEHARQTHDVFRVATIQVNLALSYSWRGQYGAALGPFSEGLRLFEAMGASQSATRTRSTLGQLELRLGLYEQARASLATAIEESRQAGLRSNEAASIALLAQDQARRGCMDEARGGIAEAVSIYQELGLGRDSADALLDLAEMELYAGHRDEAREALGQAAGEVDLQEVMDLQIRTATLDARLAAREGNVARSKAAAEALERAFEAALGQDSPQLTWECHLSAMELADARGMPSLGTKHAVAGTRILEQMAAGLAQEIQAAFWQDSCRRAVRQRAKLQRTVEVESAMSINDGDLENRKTTEVAPVTGGSEEAYGPTVFVPQGEGEPKGRIEERFYRLLEIYRQINSELDPERLLGMVMDTAVELTGAERGFLLLGPSPDQLEVEVARNLELTGEKAAYSRSIAERVFNTGQPVVTVSARNDPRFKEYLSVHQLQLESVLCIPIHARDRMAGVLYMESRFQSGRFTPADQRLLMAFGDQVAIALTNARLLTDNIRKAEELQQAKQEIEALYEERGRLLNKRTQQLEEARRDLAETRRKLESRPGMFGMVGRSAPMLKLFHLVERVAATNVPVLVEGESGTGKEMVARAIHDCSERRKKRMVSVNCAAIPEGLLESELFGHVRGAFTGADRDRKGLFAVADGGTLFLDEIGDMPTRMQVDLLRALQEKTIRPVGGQKDFTVDVRIIAASNKPLAQLVPLGKFREDLYYRLNVVALKLPPLRARTEDIPLLVDHFLDRIAAQMKGEKKHLTHDALRRLSEYGWPGNVRQLEHALLNAAVLADDDVLTGEDFTLEAPEARPLQSALPVPTSGQDRRAREKQRILEALEACNWNKSQAARKLDMPRRTFYRRLKVYDIS